MHTLRRYRAYVLAALALGFGACDTPALGEPATLSAPDYGQAFWSDWGDGRAELSTYDLSFPRYGEARTGTAVAIFVTEPFSAAARVKADASNGDDVFQAIKLNLVKDFSTGIYDYNTMLSAFVAVESHEAAAAGQAVKVSYSSQEWCGQVYQQVLFDNDVVRQTSHSYFAGEADRADVLARPAHGLSEDALPFWARGLASPMLAPGESRAVMLLRSLQRVRLAHLELGWQQAVLARDAEPSRVTVPAGSFEVETFRATIEGGPEWVFLVELAAPRRIVRWESSQGERAELVASERLPYWQLHANRDRPQLSKIGLQPRPPRTP